MNKKKTEIILNATVVVLAVILAVIYAINAKWVISGIFLLIGVLNTVSIFIRLKK